MTRKIGLLLVCCWVYLGIGGEQAVGQTDVGGVVLSGRVHRVVMLVEDGASSNVFFMDSEQAASMLRADATDDRWDAALRYYPTFDRWSF